MRFSRSVVLAVALLAALTHGDATEVQGQITGETQHAEQVAVEVEAGQSLRDGLRGLLNQTQTDSASGCNYQCKPNSSRKPGRNCYDNQKDCVCNDGYFWNGRKCKQQMENFCDYECLPNSSRKPNRNCYNNQDDCVCNHGYFWHTQSKQCKKIKSG
jgi:hypothetical protein